MSSKGQDALGSSLRNSARFRHSNPVLEAASQAGLQVPGDLSVIGYDDIEVAGHLGLTTVRQLLYESGQRGVELLLDALESPGVLPVCETMPFELVERKTTAPPY